MERSNGVNSSVLSMKLFLLLCLLLAVVCAKPEVIKVKQVSDIESHPKALKDNIIFWIKKSNTFLVREAKDEFLKREESEVWLEVKYDDVSTEEFAGFVPISECLSVAKNDAGLGEITFTGSIEASLGFKKKGTVGYTPSYSGASSPDDPIPPLPVAVTELSLTLEVGFSAKSTVSGSELVTASVKPGTEKQIFIKPEILYTTPNSRRVKLIPRPGSRRLKYFVDGDFQPHSAIFAVLQNLKYTVYFVSDEVAELACSRPIGYIDLNNPFTLGPRT